MDSRIMSAPARLVGRTLAVPMAAACIVVLTSSAFAQQPPAATPAPAKPPAATPAKPAAPAKPASGAPAAPSAAPGQQSVQIPEAKLPPLMFSQWVKFCEENNKICYTGIDARSEEGRPVLAVVLIEPADTNVKKLLQVTLPLGMALQWGTRVVIDDQAPMTAPYQMCLPNGCVAIYEATPDLIGKIKKGKTLNVQAIAPYGSLTVPVALPEFAKAYDGPPTDPKVLEEREKQREEALKKKGEELKKQADEARRKLESQGQTPAKPQ